MVDKPSVHTAVTVLEWMDVNESEGFCGRGSYGVHSSLGCALVICDQALHQVSKVG